MTRDVLIKIRGFQRMDDDADEIEVITPGDYFYKNGRHYVIYDEVADGFEGSIHNIVCIAPQLVDIRKSGLVTTNMVFLLGQSQETRYETPMGEMIIGTLTQAIHLREEEDRVCVRIEYSLNINYDHVSDCSIEMDIFSRQKAQLNIRSFE